jgi:hypothetical protein
MNLLEALTIGEAEGLNYGPDFNIRAQVFHSIVQVLFVVNFDTHFTFVVAIPSDKLLRASRKLLDNGRHSIAACRYRSHGASANEHRETDCGDLMSRIPRTGPTTLIQHSPTDEARLRRIHRAIGVDNGRSMSKPVVNGDPVTRTEQRGGPVGQNKQSPDLVSIIEQKRGAWSAAALAELLECSEKQIYALARSGRMPHLRIDGMIRFDPCTTAEWLRKYIVAA